MATEDDDYDLQEAWDKACRSFATTTNSDVNPLQGRTQTPEDVLMQLKLKRHADEEKEAEYKVLKDVLGRTLVLVQNLGNIVSSAASMVYGPSTLCFNAISYLITAGQNYRNIFSSLTQLFKDVSDVLERFVIYLNMKQVDKPLRKIIHQILLSFVSICELSVRVLQGNKLLKLLKVFAFNEDDGVRDAIANLRALVERESQMKTTLTYQLVKEGLGEAYEAISGVKSSVDKMLGDARKKETDSLERKQVEKIKVTLGVQKEGDEQLKLYRHLLSETVAGSGKWIHENRNFIAWSDRTSTWDPILLLSANEGYGKSFLVTTIVHDLEKRYARSTSDSSRTTIAYYYAEQQDNGRSSPSDQGVQSITKALKTLAVQLLREPVYRKQLAAVCEDWIEPESLEELFMRLFEPCLRSHETFYVILDGVDQMSGKSVKTFLEIMQTMQAQHTASQSSRLRILLSGRSSVLKTFTESAQIKTESIDVATSNGPDLERFIADRLDRMDNLRGLSQSVQNLRKEVLTSLSEGAKGDFVNVELLLKEIASKRWPAEIREVLANKSQRSDTIAREVKRCNQSFQPRDIHDLNTLLTWVMSAKRTLTVEELEAVLFLKNKEVSLTSLYDQLCDRYAAFFIVEKAEFMEEKEASVTLVSDSIRQYFRRLSQSKDEEESNKKGKIQSSEVKIIRHFLNNVCDEDLYAKFGFEEFFERKLSSKTALIHVDPDNTHLNVLFDCLQTIPRFAEVEVRPLCNYVCQFFVSHLQEIDLTTVSLNDKAQLGQHLVDMFSDDAIIAKWWNKDQISHLAPTWFYADSNVDIVLSWLKESGTIKKCSPADQDWVKTLTSNSFPEADLLEHVATYIASCLFSTSSALDAYTMILVRMLHAFLRKIRRRKNPAKPLSKVNVATKPITVKQINDISRWAAERLQIDKPGYEWKLSVARAYRQFGHYEEAIQAYLAANEMQQDHWLSDSGLASTYADLEEWAKAAEVYEAVRKTIEASEARDVPPEHVLEIRLDLAWAWVQTGEYDKAIALYDQHLATNSNVYASILGKLVALMRQEKYQSIIGFVQQLQQEKHPEHGSSRLSATFHNRFWYSGFHNALVLAGKKTGMLPFVQMAYRSAIEEAMDPRYLPRDIHAKTACRVMLASTLADILYRYSQSPEDQEEAIELWESCLTDSADMGFADSRWAAAKSLSTVYFEQLRSNSPDTPKTVQKLLQLSGETTPATDVYDFSLDTRLLVGRYYSKVGMKKEAKDCLRGHIRIGLDLLSDEDPSNDWQGYLRLASTLMYFGDEENALAAWSLVGPDDFDQQDELDGVDDMTDATNPNALGMVKENQAVISKEELHTSSASDGQQSPGQPGPWNRTTTFRKKEGPLLYFCDGGTCEHDWTYANDIHVCMDCLDVMFATPCYQLLRKDALEIKVCSPVHEFLHVPPWDEQEADARGPHSVRRAGKATPVSQWINEIRREWELEDDLAR